MFYNRVDELNMLEDRWKTPRAELLVIYGRRRLGKTELVKQFIQNKRALYLFVNDIEEKTLLESFSTEMARQLNANYAITTVPAFFDALAEVSQKKIVIVLDEFQRFKTNAPRFVTELQNRWDADLKKTQAKIVLVGSSIGMMQRIALSPPGALFKRKTGALKIQAFPYSEFRKIFPDYAEETKIRLYSIFGGTPDYFTKIQSDNIQTEITKLMLKKDAPLYEEPQTLLETESKRSARYNTILEAIAYGKTTIKEIADKLHLAPADLTPYLHDLSKLLDTIETDEPVFGKKKTTRYCFKDPFFLFWYRFVLPNQSTLQINNHESVWKQIQQNISMFEGQIFERIARELVLYKNHSNIGNISLSITQIGHWWNRQGTAEIDLVAQNKNGLVLGEIRYQNKPMEYNTLADLVERKQKILLQAGKTPGGKIDYVFFSKKGFSSQAKEYAKKIDAELIDLERLTRIYNNKE